MAPRPRTAEDFWKNVNKGEPHECWEWQRSCTSDGYGQTTYLGSRWATHRLAYFLAHGKKSNRLVLHRCDNPPCCNPAHLYEGDQRQNKRDEIERGRQAIGARNGNAVLTDELVCEIRRRARSGETLVSIARSMDRPITTICNAARNHWNHVAEPPVPARRRATVTPSMREAIVRMYDETDMSQSAIGREFGVDQTTVSAIVRNHEEGTTT